MDYGTVSECFGWSRPRPSSLCSAAIAALRYVSALVAVPFKPLRPGIIQRLQPVPSLGTPEPLSLSQAIKHPQDAQDHDVGVTKLLAHQEHAVGIFSVHVAQFLDGRSRRIEPSVGLLGELVQRHLDRGLARADKVLLARRVEERLGHERREDRPDGVDDLGQQLLDAFLVRRVQVHRGTRVQ